MKTILLCLTVLLPNLLLSQVECTIRNISTSPGHGTVYSVDTTFVDGKIELSIDLSKNELTLTCESTYFPDGTQLFDSIQWVRKMGGYLVTVDKQLDVKFLVLTEPKPMFGEIILDMVGYRYTGTGLKINIFE